MSILVVGTVAFDNIQTPFGKAERCLGGSATYFSVAASFFSFSAVAASLFFSFFFCAIATCERPFTWTESLTSVPLALAGVTSTFGAENSADTVSWS